MARPIKKGLDYFPFDVDFFSGNKDIRILLSRYGLEGVGVYIYLLCEIYRQGYYISIDPDYIEILSSDLKIDAGELNEILKFLVSRALLDENLYVRENVLTGADIQDRYQEAVKARGIKKAVVVDDRFWLVDTENTKSYIYVRGRIGYSEINYDISNKKEIKYNKEKYKKNKNIIREDFIDRAKKNIPTIDD